MRTSNLGAERPLAEQKWGEMNLFTLENVTTSRSEIVVSSKASHARHDALVESSSPSKSERAE